LPKENRRSQDKKAGNERRDIKKAHLHRMKSFAFVRLAHLTPDVISIIL
jgi:hypothetical protein